jgi:hypothetical protein
MKFKGSDIFITTSFKDFEFITLTLGILPKLFENWGNVRG